MVPVVATALRLPALRQPGAVVAQRLRPLCAAVFARQQVAEAPVSRAAAEVVAAVLRVARCQTYLEVPLAIQSLDQCFVAKQPSPDNFQ
jgi:hypothetical protein